MNSTKYGFALILAAIVWASAGYAAEGVSNAPQAGSVQMGGREIVSSQSNPYYDAVLSLRWGPEPCCDSFSLRVVNNSGSPMEILWDKTFYIHNGMREGRLLFGKSSCDEAAGPRTSYIPPGGSFEATVWPENLVHTDRSPAICWHSFVKMGQNAIFITAKAAGVEMSETVTLNLDFEHLFPKTT
jgi:hypothetical protein